MNLPELSAERVSQLVRELDTKGFTCIPNYIAPTDLERMQSFVDGTIAKTKHEYVHFNGPDAVRGSGLDELAQSSQFIKLMYGLYQGGTGKAPARQDFYQVLRCLAGKSGQKNSLMFHYDSYVVTALIPIAFPEEGLAGDLLMYPNTRKIRSSYLVNVMEKIVLDNFITQRVLRACIHIRRLSPMRIKMVPGNIYFFWGYRSIHTNEPCNPDKIRATALFHYANPHRRVAA